MTFPLATKFFFRSILVILLIGISFTCTSRDLPKRPEPPVLVNDFAGILSAQDKALLEKKLVAFDDSTSSQLCIVILKTLDGEPASSYAPELFNFWKIGQEGRNNGILILVSMDNPRETFINTGYGMEEFVPDIMAGRIVQEDLLPYFKKEQYYEGLDKASSDLMQMLKGTFKGFKKKNPKQKIPPIAILVLIILAVILISKSKGGGGGHYMRTFGGAGLGGFGGGGFGSGSGGGFGGGGFGGFGGGSSGGGGAGGSW
jgi:uncharacterized protein